MIGIIVEDKSPELFGKLQQAVSRFQRRGILHIEGEIKSSMAEPKSGNVYPRGADSEHIASAPDESPAVDSSNLIGSPIPQIVSTIGETGIASIIPNTLEAKLGTQVEYAAYLEDGTDNMEARPVWERTVQEELPTLERLLAFEIEGIQ